MITVLVPAYNEREYITDCLDSIQAQLDDGDELLVGDDNSSDGTTEILRQRSLKHDNIGVSLFDENRGKLAVLEALRQHATNDLLLVIDADCILSSGSLAECKRQLGMDYPIVYGKIHVKNTNKLHPAACQLGKERGSAEWYGAACVGFQDSVIENLGGFEAMRQNIEREVMHYAETNDIAYLKTDTISVASAFPESMTEWLPRKLSSGAIYVRECADSPTEFDLWELRGPAFWTGLYGLSIIAWPIALLCFSFILLFNYEDGRTIAKASGKRRYLLLYPLYQVFSGMLRTLGVWKESPLLVKTLWRKYA